MKITGTGMIFKNQYGYSISDNQKKQDGSYENFTIPCQFRKGIEVADKTKLSFDGFTKPYKTRDNKTMVSYFINEFEIIGQAPIEDKPSEKNIDNDPFANAFAEFGDSLEVDDSNFLD